MRLSKIAYEAYVKKAGGVSLITGEKLPEFDDLKVEIQAAWAAAAHAVEYDLIGPMGGEGELDPE